MYITRIRLKNIRGFRQLDLDVSEDGKVPRMRTVILGRNGTGKTTLLRCIAVGLCGHADANALIAEPNGQLIAEGAADAEIRIDLVPQNGTGKVTEVLTKLENRHGQDVVKSQEPSLPPSNTVFVCGYGAGRSTEGPDTGRPYRIVDSTYTLFNYDQTLIDPELMLRRLRDFLGTKNYRTTMSGIRKVLGLSNSDKIYLPKGGGVFVAGPSIGKRIPLQGWADGYRRTFNWILDLYGWAIRARMVTMSGGIRGILLIDELEQHLHPSMQSSLPGLLANLLPEIQVFFTTHSPLATLGSHPNEVIVLYREGKHIFAETQVPNFIGYSAEDVLRDEDLFATQVYAPEWNKKLEEYRQLAEIPKSKLGSARKQKLKKLAQELREQQFLHVEDSRLIKELSKVREELGIKKQPSIRLKEKSDIVGEFLGTLKGLEGQLELTKKRATAAQAKELERLSEIFQRLQRTKR